MAQIQQLVSYQKRRGRHRDPERRREEGPVKAEEHRGLRPPREATRLKDPPLEPSEENPASENGLLTS